MKNQDLNGMLTGLDNVKSLKGFKFAIAVSKNKDLILKEIESIQGAVEQKDAFKTFENLRIELCKEHSVKDSDNNPTIVNDAYVLIDKQKFQEAFISLEKEHSKAITERKEQLAEAESYLKEECEIDFKCIKQSDISDEITSEQISGIKFMIEDY